MCDTHILPERTREKMFTMEYLLHSWIPLSIVLFLVASGSQGVDGEPVGTPGRHIDGPLEDVVCKLKEYIFELGEKNKSVPMMNLAEIDDIYQKYSLQDNCAHPRDCDEVKCCGKYRSGVYKVYQYGLGDGYYVYCDLHGDQHGWTVIQRRQDGSVDFNRDWADYETGFGQLNGEFWLGLSKIHDLVSQRPYQLQVKLRNFTGGSVYAKYDWFFVSGPADKYRLQIGRYSGTAGDSLTYRNSMKFSTKDQDNDVTFLHIAATTNGAWWYKDTPNDNLNGVYCGIHYMDKGMCVNWSRWNNRFASLQYTEMLVRPVTTHSACPSRD